jgi:hypothetical protein
MGSDFPGRQNPWSHVAEALTTDRPGLVVLDPLAVALDACLAIITDTT